MSNNHDRERELGMEKVRNETKVNNSAANVRNMADNYHTIVKMFQKRDYTLPHNVESGPAIVTGSGPSLDVAAPYLNEIRQKHHAPIFSAPSHTYSLMEYGVRPDYIVAHDIWPGTDAYVPMPGQVRGIEKCRIVTQPSVWPGVLRWPGIEKSYMYTYRYARDIEQLHEHDVVLSAVDCMQMLFVHNPHLKYPISISLYVGPDTALQAGLIATAMGYSPILYVGYDLCFWKDRARCRTILPDGTVRPMSDWLTTEYKQAGRSECGFYATKQMGGYKMMALIYQVKINMDGMEVVCENTPGNLGHYQRVYLEDLLSGVVPIPDPNNKNVIRTYLRSMGITIK